jgi:hypothetical protein
LKKRIRKESLLSFQKKRKEDDVTVGHRGGAYVPKFF